MAGEPVLTRGFEPREGPYRAISDDSELWAAFLRRCEELSEICQAAVRQLPADDEVA